MQSVQLLDVKTREMTQAVLETLRYRHLLDFEVLWMPLLRATAEDDAHWDWVRKQRIYRNRDKHEKYAIACAQATQGMMVLDTTPHQGRYLPHQSLLYVDYLATAPWNRRSIQTPTYRLVGSTLLEFARYRSHQLGHGGYIGLHALPKSQAFYLKIGMIGYGEDPQRQHLHYFEWPPDENAN